MRMEMRRSMPPIYRQPPGRQRKQERANIPGGPIFQDRGRGRGGIKREERVYGRRSERIFARPERQEAPWSTGWVPPGQIRSAEVHERNAIRKAVRQRDTWYGYGGYYPSYIYPEQYYSYAIPYSYTSVIPYVSPVYIESYTYVSGGYLPYSPLYLPNAFVYAPYSTYSYYPDYYSYYSPYPYNVYYDDYDYGFDWKSMLVRTLISFVLGGVNDDYYQYDQYDPYYGYSPTIYGYDNYAPYDGYYPATYSETVYVQPVYEVAGYESPLIDVLPVGDLFGPTYGGYSSETLREVLAQGYAQGYQAGWYARENQLANDYLINGYRIDDEYYDPYSYTIGENRRCFTEGYVLGYQDALNSRENQFATYSRDPDLFSLMMSNVIGSV